LVATGGSTVLTVLSKIEGAVAPTEKTNNAPPSTSAHIAKKGQSTIDEARDEYAD